MKFEKRSEDTIQEFVLHNLYFFVGYEMKRGGGFYDYFRFTLFTPASFYIF